MPLVLRPQRSFTVVRQIANWLDSDTNYVQAVIRNAYTDAIIATLQLTDRGGQRFSKNWRVPVDPSGEGFFISIVTSVYTDSGYTTKNQNYGDEENTYLVQDDVALLRRGGAGGGIDIATLRRVIQEELDKRTPEPVVPQEAPKMPKMRFDEVLKAIAALPEALKQAPAKPVDLKPVLAGIEGVKAAVEAKEVTPETDMTPVLTALADFGDTLQKNHEETLTTVDGITPAVTEAVGAKVTEAMQNHEFSVAPTVATAAPKAPAAPAAPAAPKLDLQALAA